MVYAITMRYAYAHTYEWSPSIAYAVGLIASDGCLQKDGRHIDLTSVDKEQLKNFSLALNRKFHIGTKNSGAGNPGYRIQFSDVSFYDFLLKVGLTPNKSKTIGFLNIPDKFYADFLRGLFDGDGCAYGYMDPRWKSSFMFYIGYASASPLFLDYIRQTNGRLINVGRGSVRLSKGIGSLYYAKKDSHKLFHFMYYPDHYLSLSRKKLKLLDFVLKDKA
jgi:LAGLIDADG-like domain